MSFPRLRCWATQRRLPRSVSTVNPPTRKPPELLPATVWSPPCPVCSAACHWLRSRRTSVWWRWPRWSTARWFFPAVWFWCSPASFRPLQRSSTPCRRLCLAAAPSWCSAISSCPDSRWFPRPVTRSATSPSPRWAWPLASVSPRSATFSPTSRRCSSPSSLPTASRCRSWWLWFSTPFCLARSTSCPLLSIRRP
jgi:pbuX: xanthine permease